MLRALLTGALLVAVACKEPPPPPKPDEPIHMSLYWRWVVEGRVTSSEDREGRRYVETARTEGKPFWLPLEDIDRMPDKAEAIMSGVRDLLDLASPGIEAPRRLAQLERWAGVTLASVDEIPAWDRENGDFLVWSESEGRAVVDEERKRAHRAAAIDGVLVALAVDADVWHVKDSLPVRIRVTNTAAEPRSIEPYWPMVRITLESFDTLRDALMKTPPRSWKPLITLQPGEHTEVTYDLADVIHHSVRPGPHTIVAKVGSPLDGGWKGTATSLRHFLDVKRPQAEKDE